MCLGIMTEIFIYTFILYRRVKWAKKAQEISEKMRESSVTVYELSGLLD
jgi:hypothetical protein